MKHWAWLTLTLCMQVCMTLQNTHSDVRIIMIIFLPHLSCTTVVISGNARFTVLTPQLIRMEYSNNGQFEDRATLAFLNRNVTVPQFTSSTSGGLCNALMYDWSIMCKQFVANRHSDHLDIGHSTQVHRWSSIQQLDADCDDTCLWHISVVVLWTSKQR